MREFLSTLHQLRRAHGPRAAAERLRLLTAGRGRRPGRGRALVQWHDELLYATAYPDSQAVLRTAEAALQELARQRRP
ncbi:MAG TPA: hypothetical protein VF885_05255, partial [Arthrobacter sp.]